MGRRVQKTLSLDLEVVEKLENEADEKDDADQSGIVEEELSDRYGM